MFEGWKVGESSMISIIKSNEFPSPVGEGLGVRSILTMRQIEVAMFAAGIGMLEGLEFGKMVNKS